MVPYSPQIIEGDFMNTIIKTLALVTVALASLSAQALTRSQLQMLPTAKYSMQSLVQFQTANVRAANCYRAEVADPLAISESESNAISISCYRRVFTAEQIEMHNSIWDNRDSCVAAILANFPGLGPKRDHPSDWTTAQLRLLSLTYKACTGEPAAIQELVRLR